MANQKVREKRRAQRLRQRQIEKERSQAIEAAGDEELLEEDGEQLLDFEGGEEISKDYCSAAVASDPTAFFVPVSWEEEEAARELQEKNQQVQRTAWTVEDLVGNIIRHPLLSPREKADKIKAVGDGFGDRVQAIMDSHITKSADELDALYLEVILAKELRSLNVLERLGYVIQKAELASASRAKLSDEDFALPSKRKYPIHDKAHVRNALARAAQMLKLGGESAKDARAALPAIRAAAKKFGIGMDKERNAVLIEKDASETWRWVGWPSNNFVDFDNEIISEKAHIEYVEWLNKNMDCAPVFMSWHTPGTVRENRVDFADYADGFLIMSGPLTDSEAASLLTIQKETDLGMSHGTIVLERNPSDKRIIEKYRMAEVSDLPLDRAANPFTDFETISKEVEMNKKEYLALILGSDEKAEAFMQKTEMKKEALTAAGVESKEAPPVEPPQEQQAQPATAEEIVAQVLKELDVNGLSEFVQKAQEAMAKVPVLEEVIKELQGAKEEQLAEMISPQAPRFAWSKRPSQNEETVVKEGDSLKSAKPELPWLNEITGTQPLQ